MISNILSFLLWLSVWLILGWPPNLKYLLTGIFAALFVTLATVDIFRATNDRKDEKRPAAKRNILGMIKSTAYFLNYAVVFLWECVKSNFDVAYRVIHPDAPIRPATVKIKVGLKSDLGLTFLANSITLTPGTTTVDIDKNNGYIYVHLLYMRKDYDATSGRLAIVEKFENILKKVFE